MDAALLASLETIVSPGRLQRYKSASSSDVEAATLYLWNIELTQALLPAIAILEVSLRNSVHNVFAAEHGDYWFQSVLQPPRYQMVELEIQELRQKFGPTLPVGKVIANLTFGFWPHIFAHYYRHLWWNPPQPRLARVLPNHPKLLPSTRKDFMHRLLYFNNLRNRAMHHEPIFQGVASVNKPPLPIETLHADLLETIDWINPEAHRLLSCIDQFPTVFSATGQQKIADALRSEFGLM